MTEPTKGIECLGCGAIITEDEDPDLDETAPCETCGGEGFQPVEISPCARERCVEDDHHYGRGDHVRTVQR